jgi:CspA family cold shock protein
MQPDSKTGAVAKGTVLWFNEEKGYGFIRNDDGGPDCFVHFSAINSADKRRTLLKDQRVQFEVIQGKNSPAAHNVKVVTE